jgi:hypothetical protein
MSGSVPLRGGCSTTARGGGSSGEGRCAVAGWTPCKEVSHHGIEVVLGDEW